MCAEYKKHPVVDIHPALQAQGFLGLTTWVSASIPSEIASALRDPINQVWDIRSEQAEFKDWEPQDEG